MAVKTVTVREYRCDGCGEAVWSPEDDSPKGYTGAVTFDDGGLGGEFQFFACRKTHLSRAIKNALAQFGENGKVADVELPAEDQTQVVNNTADPTGTDMTDTAESDSATPATADSEKVEADDADRSPQSRAAESKRRGRR